MLQSNYCILLIVLCANMFILGADPIVDYAFNELVASRFLASEEDSLFKEQPEVFMAELVGPHATDFFKLEHGSAVETQQDETGLHHQDQIDIQLPLKKKPLPLPQSLAFYGPHIVGESGAEKQIKALKEQVAVAKKELERGLSSGHEQWIKKEIARIGYSIRKLGVQSNEQKPKPKN